MLTGRGRRPVSDAGQCYAMPRTVTSHYPYQARPYMTLPGRGSEPLAAILGPYRGISTIRDITTTIHSVTMGHVL